MLYVAFCNTVSFTKIVLLKFIHVVFVLAVLSSFLLCSSISLWVWCSQPFALMSKAAVSIVNCMSFSQACTWGTGKGQFRPLRILRSQRKKRAMLVGLPEMWLLVRCGAKESVVLAWWAAWPRQGMVIPELRAYSFQYPQLWACSAVT